MVGSELTLRHRTAWRRIGRAQATAELDISPHDLPVHARGLVTIVESEPESTHRIRTWLISWVS